ncbi:hypothetical protein SISSUDRAFT_1037613 [Sistotremastrum suecicum HHB10207 ss-3]|uniref:F-box domain-containing protein n=1 Tax=Sistotremastrum suecicum HHB10207 ss-3 TaxID=1314776 RepID=A0A165XW87_9AGAM|nr:hypothetical protein SISSUDRAFT_1037613 [Sistotremastrum suecicum HHB10207 ss-3]
MAHLAHWSNLATEIICLIFHEARNACRDEAGIQSWEWMELLKVCRTWRNAGLGDPLLWDSMPSIVPDFICNVFWEHYKSNPDKKREMWIRPDDEGKHMTHPICVRAETVHVEMWRDGASSRKGPFWLGTELAPPTNTASRVKHIVLHAGRPIKSLREQYISYRVRTAFHVPTFKGGKDNVSGKMIRIPYTHHIETISFIFYPGRNEQHMHCPWIVGEWLTKFQGIETATVTHMGPSGDRDQWFRKRVERRWLVHDLKRIYFVNCDREAVESLMRLTDLPALEETFWDGKLYNIRLIDGNILFNSVA